MKKKNNESTTTCIAHCGWIPIRNSLQFAIFRLRRKIITDFPQRAIHKTVGFNAEIPFQIKIFGWNLSLKKIGIWQILTSNLNHFRKNKLPNLSKFSESKCWQNCSGLFSSFAESETEIKKRTERGIAHSNGSETSEEKVCGMKIELNKI